ncbi:hypothetical protein BGZ95_011863 [Linnemannia exigua]|uniref:Uncharacterized protein n=1 Tax=Linnemannia exigua TaxID=604196 RepID=A0AAD4H5C1_9FUNG|nr:hypothetical protein BGZ95_011863 [Linnemannia exigua]
MTGDRKTTKTYSPSFQAEKYVMLMQPFRDPDDAQDLLDQVIVSENKQDAGSSSDSSSEESEAHGAEDDEGGSTRFFALRFKQDFSNQRNIFLACM